MEGEKKSIKGSDLHQRRTLTSQDITRFVDIKDIQIESNTADIKVAQEEIEKLKGEMEKLKAEIKHLSEKKKENLTVNAPNAEPESVPKEGLLAKENLSNQKEDSKNQIKDLKGFVKTLIDSNAKVTEKKDTQIPPNTRKKGRSF